MTQSKVLLDPFLGGLLDEERKIDPHMGDPENKF
jgi:hypothetical protein